MMNFQEKIIELLEINMTEKGFKLWKGVNTILSNIWDKPTSTTGKYHKKLNGDVPTQGEHTYHMLYAATKLLRMFDVKAKTTDADKLLFAIVLHDSLKYGKFGSRKHTDCSHDKLAADMVCENKETFLKLFSEEQFEVFEEAIRFHSGRWSTNVSKNEKFDFNEYHPETVFVHTLDMLSTMDIIQTDVRD
jgi:hypothetical protein